MKITLDRQGPRLPNNDILPTYFISRYYVYLSLIKTKFSAYGAVFFVLKNFGNLRVMQYL